jgi:hypothetical protein
MSFWELVGGILGAMLMTAIATVFLCSSLGIRVQPSDPLVYPWVPISN